MYHNELTREMIDRINEKVNEIRKKHKKAFPNPILKEDVLDLLDSYCRVVYYPIKDEYNNGFHISDIPTRKGKKLNFVYINTAQTIEKQVFTAAHELGHICEVDRFVLDDEYCECNDDIGEKIINRFAAELLMPVEFFKYKFAFEFTKYSKERGALESGMPFEDFIKMVVTLMDFFCVPYKSVVLRFNEMGLLKDNDTKDILAPDNEKEILSALIHFFREQGLVQFINPTNRKRIEGLAEMLDKAETQNVLSIDKIRYIRRLFDLPNVNVANSEINPLKIVVSEEEH